MPDPRQPAEVLAAYPLARPLEIVSLGSAGGFSGARFWRVTSADAGQYCLRQWPPEHPNLARLEYIHAVLLLVENCDVWEAAVPLAARDGRTFVALQGRFWELTRWVPGAADHSASPPPQRVAAAMAVLGRFHRAAALMTSPRRAKWPSPGLVQRAEMIAQLQRGGLDDLRAAVAPSAWPEGEAHRATTIVCELLKLFPPAASIVQPRLAPAAAQPVALQPCIRDIWRDHVFFQENHVSGIVDFGAMRDECAAADVARLLGSYAGDDREIWQTGLDAYQQVRELPPLEYSLVSVFDQSGVLLSGINWIRWIYGEGRQFDDPARIVQRLEVTRQRLEHLIQDGGGTL